MMNIGKCQHINIQKIFMNGKYIGYHLCKDCGQQIYKNQIHMGNNNILIGNIGKNIQSLGDNNILITQTDSNGNIILDRPMVIGNNNDATENSLIIGSNNKITNNLINEIKKLIDEEKNEEIRTSFNTIEEELKKEKPDKNILKNTWEILKNLSTANGLHSLYEKLKGLELFISLG